MQACQPRLTQVKDLFVIMLTVLRVVRFAMTRFANAVPLMAVSEAMDYSS